MGVEGGGGQKIPHIYVGDLNSSIPLSQRPSFPTTPGCTLYTQEVLRRLFNSSKKPDWKTEPASVLTDYMSPMKQAGYSEWYRKESMISMVEDKSQEVSPLYRPKDYDIVNRRNQKVKKRNNWSNRRGGTLDRVIIIKMHFSYHNLQYPLPYYILKKGVYFLKVSDHV